MPAYSVGAVFPSEARSMRDPRTNARIVQLTDHPSIHHNLYFLTSSFTPDEQSVVVASYRSGQAAYYRIGFPDGPMVQLTDEPDLHGYSGLISPKGDELFYTAGSRVRAVSLDTFETRTLAEYPGGQLGELSVNANSTLLVAAMKRDGHSHITITRMDGTGGETVFECPRTIIHPQFHSTDPDLIEYAQDPAPRMWTIRRDGSGNTNVYHHENNEFIVHENFLGDKGEELVFVVWPYALKRIRLSDAVMTPIASFNAWHIASNRAGDTILCDTVHPDTGLHLVDVATGARRTLCYPESSCGGSQWRKDRYAVAEDWKAAADEKAKSLSWMEMKVDTVYGPQWTHPHPSYSPTERWVVYTSDRTGYPQVYAVEISA
ncbi:MAG: PD40 domain-containing protein [candidate division Zixibacteria bacterium]|nr:PD40 domain-containing protein [candidate division Zixibacteria bacterium]